ncbi:MAG: hypothetical protein ACRES8_05055 [Nevskiaceae bacterium]
MKKHFCVLALCAALAAPLPALAQSGAAPPYGNLSYTYLDGRLVLWEPDGGDRLDGIRLGGSMLFQHNLFGVGSLTTVSDSGFDLTLIDLGIGFRQAYSSSTDFVAIGGIVLAEADTPGPGGDRDDTGISLTGGVRSLVGPQFELGGYVNYADYFGDGDITLIGEGLLHVTPNLSLAASLGFSDDYDVLTFGARWNFR